MIPNEFFLCKSIILDKYTDLYDYDWNLNGTVTKLPINKRYIKDVTMNSVVCFPVRWSNSLNFRKNQVASLKFHSDSCLNNQLQFQEFMRNYLTSSTIPPVALTLYPKRNQKATELLIENQQTESNIRAETSFTKVICTNNNSVSVLIIDHDHSKCNGSLTS